VVSKASLSQPIKSNEVYVTMMNGKLVQTSAN